VLIMSVNPGFGGQEYIPASNDKIARLRQLLEQRRLGHIHIQVDGGLSHKNVAQVVAAGATNLVAGSAIFNDRQTVAEAIGAFRAALASH